jgi:hypothetical protein
MRFRCTHAHTRSLPSVIFYVAFQVISIEVNNGKEGSGPVKELMKAKGYSPKARVIAPLKPALRNKISLIDKSLPRSIYLIYQLSS